VLVHLPTSCSISDIAHAGIYKVGAVRRSAWSLSLHLRSLWRNNHSGTAVIKVAARIDKYHRAIN
jgi:hypothetical protein